MKKFIFTACAFVFLVMGTLHPSVYAACDKQGGSYCFGTNSFACGQLTITGGTHVMWCCESASDVGCKSPPSNFNAIDTGESKVCDSINDGTQKDSCEICMDGGKKVWTAIGCVEVTSAGLTNKLLPFGISIAGGIAFLLILFGALQMMMSAGNPEKLNAGKELVTAAITGLLLIIFSIFLLQLIGVKILVIPGFK